jgi:hypothetical protein
VTRTLPRFVLATLAWLPVAFVFWYLAAPLLLWAPRALAEAVLQWRFPDLVAGFETRAHVLQVITTLKPGQAVSGGVVSIEVNLLLYTFGLPMLAALVLAAREPGWPGKLAIGYAAMLPFIAWGVVADVLKNVAIGAGPVVASQSGFTAPERELIAFAYQFGTLILPTVVPAVAWVLTHRAFLERMRDQDSPAGEGLRG